MKRIPVMIYIAIFVFYFLNASNLLFAQNRYALVIGNNDYLDSTIANLQNPVNDASDVAAVLSDLGYNVTLKTNVTLREMIRVVKEFSSNLRIKSDNEGFFWFAGHGLSVRGLHYMLPVDVDPVDDGIIARSSYSVDELLDEIGSSRNKTNLIVIDACRNSLMPGQPSRDFRGGRGLTVLSIDDYRITGNKIIYSTMAGKTAADGLPGARNSPFAQAFISQIVKPEPFDDLFLDIVNETFRLTNGNQQPYSMGNFAIKSYTLYPLIQKAGSAETTLPVISIKPPVYIPDNSAVIQQAGKGFNLDNRTVMSLAVVPSANLSTFSGSNIISFPAIINSLGYSFAKFSRNTKLSSFISL